MLLAVALACAVAALLTRPAGRVVFAEDVELTGASLTREVSAGSKATVRLRFHVKHALATDEWVFIHVEEEREGGGRRGLDQAPKTPSTRWSDQDVTVEAQTTLSSSDKLGQYNVYVGLYDRQHNQRLTVVDPPSPDNRVLIGSIQFVDGGGDGSERAISPGEIRTRMALRPLRPWAPWALAIALTCGMAARIFARRRAEGDPETADARGEDAASDERLRRATLLAPAVAFVMGILAVLEFIKDDAYISFRYAHNLVTGNGLVFNHGERVEGFTNFLWIFVVAPFEALGWDLFQVCEVLGTILGIACLVYTGKLTAWIHGQDRTLSHLWGAFWLATSSSFVLWAQAGLEQPLASLLPIAGAFVLWTARDRLGGRECRRAICTPADRGGAARAYGGAGLLLGAACMTRPELHMMAVLVALPLAVDVVRWAAARARGSPGEPTARYAWLYAAGVLAVTVPCHTFRWLYYGSLVPNTFYAKTASGPAVWHAGLGTLRDMFAFNHMGLLVVAAPLAFANRRRLLEKATIAAIAIAFMAFYVSVGVDEMQWHRLYLPALPFLCVLAALGVQNAARALVLALSRTGAAAAGAAAAERLTRIRNAVYGSGWVAFLVAGGASFAFTYREMNGFNGHGDLTGTYHPDLGKFLVRHERPGGLVAFQDMGSTPYHAPDIDFLDFVGLVDSTVAHARHDAGIHAFIGSESSPKVARYEADMRDYFFRRAPEWAILTIYTPAGRESELTRKFNEDPTGGSFADAYKANPFQWGIWDDPRFRERYVAVRTWPRSSAYYLALWRRRDLWEQTPREVVLDAAPPDLSGVKAKFEGGLELLGSEMTHETREHYESLMTTWWRAAGPLPKDVYFFVHLNKAGFQYSQEHVPGDWMYPADRWHEGDIIEDRTLLQLPPFTVRPGTYDVYVGVYRRSTGDRLKVLEGPSDGSDRVHLGTLVVDPLYPIVNQLIPPTRVDQMRKYPDRIIDSHALAPRAPRQ